MGSVESTTNNFLPAYRAIDENQESFFDWLKSCDDRYFKYKCDGNICYFDNIVNKISQTRPITDKDIAVKQLFDQINQDRNFLMAHYIKYIVIRNNHDLPIYVFENETPSIQYSMYVDL